MATNQRLHYFDVMKGLAIFMVVMGHVLTMCIRDIDRAVLFKIVGQIHMPLFFFISGYFTYKSTQKGNFAQPDLWQRFKQLMIPFFAVSSIWIYYFPVSGLQSPLDSTWHGLYFNHLKNGYWFTPCLFEIILLYAITCPLLRMAKNLATELIVTAGCIAAIYLITFVVMDTPTRELTGMGMMFSFYPAFMYGVLARKHRDGFERIIAMPATYTISLLGLMATLYVAMYYWEFDFMSIAPISYGVQGVMHILLVAVVIDVVKPWVEKAYTNGNGSRAIGCWELLGRESLGIYLLHYFFLFPMTSLQEPLRGMSLAPVPTLAVSIAVAAAIIAVTLLVIKIIQRSPLLGLLLTGNISRK